MSAKPTGYVSYEIWLAAVLDKLKYSINIVGLAIPVTCRGMMLISWLAYLPQDREVMASIPVNVHSYCVINLYFIDPNLSNRIPDVLLEQVAEEAFLSLEVFNQLDGKPPDGDWLFAPCNSHLRQDGSK